MIRYLLIPTAILAISSCAPISEDQCRGGDWSSIGLADGQKGKLTSVLSKYSETCAEFGISPNRDTYLAARAEGLKFYCTPQNAYNVGRNGKRLNNVCEPQIQQSISPAYKQGRRFHEITERMNELDKRIDDLRDELRRMRDAKPTTGPEVRASLIQSRIRDLRHDIFVLELEKDRYDSYP